MDYNEQIKHPKWQKRRLDILNRDKFTCQICGDTESTLHVHHLMYEKDKNIWEYDDWQLITLCESCHENEHQHEMGNIIDDIKYIQEQGVTLFEIQSLLDGIIVSLICRNNEVIQGIIGTDGNCKFKDYGEIKNLTDRRIKTKERFYKEEDIKKEQFRKDNSDDPF